jgi:hypothetical protein
MDKNKSEQDHQQFVQEIKEQIIDKVPMWTIYDISFVGWKDINDFLTTHGTRFDKDSERMQELTTALRKPEEYTGIFQIEAGDNIDNSIYKVIGGRITQDSYDLAMQFKFPVEAERQIQDTFRKCEASWVLDSVTKLVNVLGQRQQDNTRFYQQGRYSFSYKLGSLSVKNDGVEILNNEGYTPYATNKDRRNMNVIDRQVKQVEDVMQAERQELKQNLSPKL